MKQYVISFPPRAFRRHTLEQHSGGAHMRMRTIGKALVLAMAVSGIAALSVAQTAQKPAFEVVSIKAITSSNPFGTRPISITGGTLRTRRILGV
jgi:hypothetical protein